MASKKPVSGMVSGVVGFERRVIGVCGSKDVGKTRVVEGLARFLRSKGFSVGTVKHVHGDVALEPYAADSMRHLSAGAACVVAVSDTAAHVTAGRAGRSDDQGLAETCGRYLATCDCIVVEGFKRAAIPKILVTRSESDVPRGLNHVMARVYSGAKPKGLPAFRHSEIQKLGRFLLDEGVLVKPGARAHLMVNDKAVPMNEFVGRALAGILEGFVGSLRDTEKPTKIEVSISTPRK